MDERQDGKADDDELLPGEQAWLKDVQKTYGGRLMPRQLQINLLGMSMVCSRSMMPVITGLTSLPQLESATLSRADRAKGGHIKALTCQLPSLGHED